MPQNGGMLDPLSRKIGTIKTPESASGALNLAANNEPVTDKRGYAKRVKLSPRTIENFLATGMPHWKIGKRRVRIVVSEADAWMRERFGAQRYGTNPKDNNQDN